MKSSTLNPCNLESLKYQKRFDAIVKQHIVEHEHLLSCYHKEMQSLRESLSLAMEKFESLFDDNNSKLKDLNDYTIGNFGLLKTKHLLQENIILSQKNTIDDLHKLILEFQKTFASKDELEKNKTQLFEKINEENFNNLTALDKYQRQLKMLIESHNTDFNKFRNETHERFKKILDEIDIKYNLLKIDRDSVLKQIRIYNKDTLIIDKKIEHLYILIQRLRKEGETCRKPD